MERRRGSEVKKRSGKEKGTDAEERKEKKMESRI